MRQPFSCAMSVATIRLMMSGGVPDAAAFYEQFTCDSIDIAPLLATASIAASQRNTNS
jgi:hypothetical protein